MNHRLREFVVESETDGPRWRTLSSVATRVPGTAMNSSFTKSMCSLLFTSPSPEARKEEMWENLINMPRTAFPLLSLQVHPYCISDNVHFSCSSLRGVGLLRPEDTVKNDCKQTQTTEPGTRINTNHHHHHPLYLPHAGVIYHFFSNRSAKDKFVFFVLSFLLSSHSYPIIFCSSL